MSRDVRVFANNKSVFDVALVIPNVRDIYVSREARGHIFFGDAWNGHALFVDTLSDILLGYNESEKTYSVWLRFGDRS